MSVAKLHQGLGQPWVRLQEGLLVVLPAVTSVPRW